METRHIENLEREQCPECSWIYYRHLKVGAAALIENEYGELLLLIRSHEPWEAYWNIPAGYVEVDEPPEQAAVREVWEETGLEVEVNHLAGAYFFDDDPRGNGLLLVYWANVVGGELTNTPENLGFDYFSRETLPVKICGAAHDVIVSAWKEGRLER
jgi:ADP-ribose pyrophosphatase YjhB (NUDIX family)